MISNEIKKERKKKKRNKEKKAKINQGSFSHCLYFGIFMTFLPKVNTIN